MQAREHPWFTYVKGRPEPADVTARLDERDARAAADTRSASERLLGDPEPWRRHRVEIQPGRGRS